MIFSNIVIFYCLALTLYCIAFIYKKNLGSEELAVTALGAINFKNFEKKNRILLYVFLLTYLVNIIGSGGVPIFWVLTGDERTYVDFGLPTLGGLSNMLRAFLLTSCYLIYSYSDLSLKIKRKYLMLGVGLILSAFLLETGRGNGVVLLLHPIGLFMLLHKFRLTDFIVGVILCIVFLMGLGAIQMIRYGEGIESLKKYAENSGMQDVEGPALLLVPAINYMAVPVVNLDLNVIKSPAINFSPYYSVQALLPTVIRDHIFEKGDYGELINSANNVSSFYIPLVRDFGIFGAILFVTFFQFLVITVYIKAQRGSIFCILFWPPLFMSLVLSFFSLYFTSLVVVLYPALVFYITKKYL
jgi:oligosaccharide repeat unit polymerase